MTKKIFLLLLIANVSLISFSQNAEVDFPTPIGFVNDFEGIFTSEEINQLETIISEHEKETSNEIAVVTILSYEPFQSIEEYSLKLGNHWRIGKKGKNNGIMIVFGKKLREIRIDVGLGLENKLKDEEAKQIIDNTIIPEFKKGNFFEGIKKGLFKIIEEVN